jgi:hypothetical protein
MSYYGERVIYVMQSCTNDRVPEKDAGEFLNIEEGSQGEDVLTYKCCECGQEHKSRRFG